MPLPPPLLPIGLGIAALLALGAIDLGSSTADPIRQVRGRLLLALGAFGAVLLASWAWSTAQPELLGRPIVVGPGAAAAIGVLVFSLPPARAVTGRTRAVSLRRRSARHVVGGRVLVLPVVLLVALVAILVVTGATADSAGDGAGRVFSVVRPGQSASGSPYPGWFYGGPILIAAASLVVSVSIAVRRIVLLPAVSADDAVDDAWRAGVGRALGAIAGAGLLLSLSGVLWASNIAWDILGATGAPGLAVLSVAQGLMSALALVAAVVLLAVAAARVLSVARAVRTRSVAA